MLFVQEKEVSLTSDISNEALKESLVANVKEKAARPKVQQRPRVSKRLQHVLKSKPAVKTKYFTSAEGVNEQNAVDMANEPSPFIYPGDLEEFAQKVMTKAWRNDIRIKELNLACSQRPSYKDRQRKGLLNRLYVKEPTVENIQTILDIDPDYFNTVEGRPIPNKLDMREYVDTVRACLRTKIITGYRKDDIMQIDENLMMEQKIIDAINRNYHTYVNTFEEFLYKDHTTAMKLLQESEQMAHESFKKAEELQWMSKMYGTLRSSIFNLEEKWRNCKTYQKFLYVTSPRIWRMSQKKFRRASVFLVEDDPDDEENIFGMYRLSVVEKGVSLTDIINTFKEELMDEVPPQLYFTEPQQLMDVFHFMEVQNLNSLIHTEELALPLEQVKNGMVEAVESFEAEIKTLQEVIDKLEGGICWEENRAKYLEEYAMRLVDNEFKSLMMDDEVLNLFVFVEDCYETRIAPNDANLSMLKMMKAIEERYRSELLVLDMVPSEQVALLEGSLYSEEMMVMKLAERAARQYAELERLTYSLNKAFEPPPERALVREPKNRSPPPGIPKPVVIPPRSLTENEKMHLEYFTEFCQYTESPSLYGIHISGEPEEVEKVKKEHESREVEVKDAVNPEKEKLKL
ncbi:hypothetical protein NQ318_006088 [Aromia moschata]|uniref:Uncharacterized protein n=1 Tax=Aromia moschata TaxID=1265417 RepID=A0AAV8Z2L6_9CUCU|nr:hypothetical protein NQ318_006088 [Aromia moschata]